MKTSKQGNEVIPFYQQPQRTRTPPAEARRCMERGWTFNGKRYASRADWESSVLRYHGVFTLPSDKSVDKRQ